MTITLELSAEEEAELRQQATRLGISPEDFLRRAILSERRSVLSVPTLADRMAEILGPPDFGQNGDSNWSEIEAACDAP